jgi:hypothetical protein
MPHFPPLFARLRREPSRAMSSPSRLSTDEIARLNEERRSSMLRKFSVPIMYAPLLPIVRVAFRHNPPVRDRLFAGCILAALTHAGVVMFSDSSVM